MMKERYTQDFNQDAKFEQSKFYEIEQKYVGNLHAFDHYRDSTLYPNHYIHQSYLSRPEEPYSLRLRKTIDLATQETTYTATLKGDAIDESDLVKRLEIETDITQEVYEYYNPDTLPFVEKVRTYVAPNITIDWCSGVDAPAIEIEETENADDTQQAIDFLAKHAQDMRQSSKNDCTHSMEALAHTRHNSSPLPEIIDEESLAGIIYARHQEKPHTPTIVAIAGRSGSGKTTLINSLTPILEQSLSTICISTDDYNKGVRALEQEFGAPCKNWDAPEVYDTKAAMKDIRHLIDGNPIKKRVFDFSTNEPKILADTLSPADIIFVEGIYAHSPDIEADIHHLIPLPLATSAGRRIFRDIHERPTTADPIQNLHAIVSQVEPAFRDQHGTTT